MASLFEKSFKKREQKKIELSIPINTDTKEKDNNTVSAREKWFQDLQMHFSFFFLPPETKMTQTFNDVDLLASVDPKTVIVSQNLESIEDPIFTITTKLKNSTDYKTMLKRSDLKKDDVKDIEKINVFESINNEVLKLKLTVQQQEFGKIKMKIQYKFAAEKAINTEQVLNQIYFLEMLELPEQENDINALVCSWERIQKLEKYLKITFKLDLLPTMTNSDFDVLDFLYFSLVCNQGVRSFRVLPEKFDVVNFDADKLSKVEPYQLYFRQQGLYDILGNEIATNESCFLYNQKLQFIDKGNGTGELYIIDEDNTASYSVICAFLEDNLDETTLTGETYRDSKTLNDLRNDELIRYKKD